MADMRSLIVICLDDDRRYIQPSRRRFETEGDAQDYADSLAESRNPIVVAVTAVACVNGRPIEGERHQDVISDPGWKASRAAEESKWLYDPPMPLPDPPDPDEPIPF